MSDDEPTQRVPPPDRESAGRGLSAEQRVFGRYTLETIAGRGGMGVVWRAHDDDLERTVALKFLPDVVASDAEAVRDLKRETKRCLDLTHPNIVRVYDFMQGTESAAIAMEFVEGQSLAKRKAEAPAGCLEVSELAPLVAQLCAALDYAHHKAHIIHRDLKPANLLVTADGELKVMDFGIARSLTETRTRLTGNAAGGTSGTLLYMSPQQLMGEKPCVADDIYALGATLFELLAGKPPFYRGDGYGLMTQIREKLPPSIAKQREELPVPAKEPVPAAWEKAIAACLAKDPAARPASAGELAVRLGLATAAPPGRAMPGQPGPLVGGTDRLGWSRRRALGWGLGTAVLVLAGAGFWFGRSKPSPVAAPPSAERTTSNATVAAAVPRPAAAVHGGVIIRTQPPGAEVAVGALDHGPGPLTIKEVAVGTYPVRVRAAGFEEWTGEITVKENDFAELTVPLVRSTGAVLITSEPAGLEVELAGQPTPGEPPLEPSRVLTTPQHLRLPTGSYRLTFRREGWPEQTKEVAVHRGQNLEANAAFLSGGVVVVSEPAGAEVALKGKRLGVTPLTVPDLQPGDYRFDLRLKGYRPAQVPATVTPRGEQRVTAALERLRAPAVGQPVVVPGLDLELRPIPAGRFKMGSPPSEPKREKNEGPVTDAGFSAGFWMGATEVTQRQYESVMGSNPSKFQRAGPQAPVENVTWMDATEFCRKLTAREKAEGRLPDGYAFALPTEAQWEYACRAGTTTPFAGEVNAVAWHEDNRDASGKTTHPVARKKPNAWGLYDMQGNVAEWCADFYSDRLPGGEVTDYTGPATGSRRVFRGGSWDHSPEECRAATRMRESPEDRDSYLGFRVVLTALAAEH